MARLFESFYRVKRRDNLGEPDYWNSRFSDLDRRLDAAENATAEIDELTARLEGIALDRINVAITPLVQETQTQLRSISNLFRAGSVSQVTVGTGPRTFTILENQRNTFAALDYVSIRATADESISMVGRVNGFDRETGELDVTIDSVAGTGTFVSWDITISSPPDLVHASRIDNPHQVTAAQIGAATTTAMAAGDTAAIATVRGGVSATYDTLQKLLTFLNSSVATLNSTIAGKANIDHDHNTLYYTKAQTDALVGGTKVNGTVELVLSAGTTSTSIKLMPKNGGNLFVNGIMETVPSTGVTATSSGLTDSTYYYVYCYKNGANLALEFSTTGYVYNSSGVAVKNGNATRTLVGCAVPRDGGKFYRETWVWLVRSWYNDPGVRLKIRNTLERSSSSTSMATTTSDLTGGFATFAGENAQYAVTGGAYNNTSGAYTTFMISIDYSTDMTSINHPQTQIRTTTGGYDLPFALQTVTQFGDDWWDIALMTRVSAGTVTLRSGATLTAYIAPRN